MIRSFVAVEIDRHTVEKIVVAVERLKPLIPGIRWVAPNNFHLTLKFLGDIEETRVDAIGEALRQTLHPFPRCTINAKGLGVFPGPRRPRILWVGLAGNQLAHLAAKVESALSSLGFAPEQRSFTPHLTIGRWRQLDRLPENLRHDLERWKDFEFGESSMHEVILFRSILSPAGAIYATLKVIKLQNE